MDVDDFIEPEVGVAVAVTAVVASPGVRHFLRQGAVYAVASALSVGEALKTLCDRVKTGAREVAANAKESAAKVADEGTGRRKKSSET